MFTKETKVIRIGSSSLCYAIIPWDSEYLHNTTIEIENFSVSSLATLKKLVIQLKHSHKLKKGDLLVSKIPLADYEKINTLDNVGFYYIEQTTTLDIDLSAWNASSFIFSNSDEYKLIPADLSDKKEIRDIAKSIFTADRFHLDAHIPKARADYRFEMWIENSFHNSDIVYKFIDKRGIIIGFFIVNEQKEYAEFRLAGLHSLYKGKGLGKILYHHMYQILKVKKFKSITSVISLNNIQVLNVYMYLTHAKFTQPLIVMHNVLL